MTAQLTGIEARPDRRRLPSRKVVPLPIGGVTAPDAIEAWAGRYLDAAVCGVRSAEVADWPAKRASTAPRSTATGPTHICEPTSSTASSSCTRTANPGTRASPTSPG
jgi:hypothetical protein